MHPPYSIPFWKTAPLTRLLFPLIAGIMLQWYLGFNVVFVLICIASFCVAFLLMNFLPTTALYYLRKFRGLIFYVLVAATGMLLTWQRDGRHQPRWYGNFYSDSACLLVKINEPLLEKLNSLKAEAEVIAVFNGNEKYSATGNVLLYFSKDSLAPSLQYGQLILVKKPLEPIKNSGNPGAFDYRRYAAFQQFYHQLFLKPGDWQATNDKHPNLFRAFLYGARAYVLDVLKRNIKNDDQQLGIAEALLIGYKEDLDKDLVQAYSNAGVVHIIAISGLHLGLIFFVLSWTFNRFPLLRKSRHIKVILLIACLWLFSLLTGGSASVLRSAVMFTVVIIGKYYFKQASVYNSLAASAFILLCYNPYYLWDVGFQLSYFAVIGIIALQLLEKFGKWPA
jgi:competence protein ComEC